MQSSQGFFSSNLAYHSSKLIAISILSNVFLLRSCLHSRIYNKLRTRRRSTLGSHIWSRRRVFWRNAGVSSYLLSVVGICVGYTFLYLTLQAIQNLPHHSSSLPYYFALGVGLCGESTSTYMWTQRMEFPCAIAADLVSLLVLLHILLSIGVRVGLNDKTRLKFRKACSRIWTRRRAYWLHKCVCRADYLALLGDLKP